MAIDKKLSDELAQKKKTLLAMEQLYSENTELKRRSAEPIAIVGMSCRLPGGANDLASYWELLKNGVDATQEIPANRWDVDAYYDSDRNAAGKMYSRRGAFIDKVDEFDPLFFGISPTETLAIDPQQRLLLEVCWEALEHAGDSPEKLFGSRTGVFIGVMNYDYFQIALGGQNIASIEPQIPIGNIASAAAGRLSFTFGFQGPAVAVDTACSSSLVTIHLACAALRNRECDEALAGGVNLILSPLGNILTCRLQASATDGRCKTFDEKADGYVRGEGCGVIVLKRLSDAQANGDRILAVVRGTAVNQDGRSSSLTAPSGKAQEALIVQALQSAHVKATEVSYVEAHGTGTPLGDPIEVQALGHVYGKGRSKNDPLLIGSVKTNIGHLESAAGVAGVIKTVLAMNHQAIPRHLNFYKLNPKIPPLEEIPARIPTELTPWTSQSGKKRIAGVSSFGISGTNAHVILEEAPHQNLDQDKTQDGTAITERPAHVLCLSGKSEEALLDLVKSYAHHLQMHPERKLADICFTASSGRSHFEERLALSARTSDELVKKLKAYQSGEMLPGVVVGKVPSSGTSKVAFLFTGGGAQYVGMGKTLYQTQPTFKNTIDQCAEILKSSLEKPLLSVLWGEDSALLDRMDYMQPALFAIEYSLSVLWRSWGVEPSAVLGHSLGEYVAATVAGVLTLEDGLRLLAKRAKLMHEAPEQGAMASVAASEQKAKEILSGFNSARVSIGAINGPQSTMISGDRAEVLKILAEFEKQGVKVKLLPISHASHSPLMEPMLDEFEKFASAMNFSMPKIRLVSNVTGKAVEGDEVCNARYWRTHVRQTVRFADGMKSLFDLGCQVFMEMGPGTTLVGMGQECLSADANSTESHWLPSLKKDREDWEQISESLGKLYVSRARINWQGFEQDYAKRMKVDLPTYPFQRKRYWVQGARPGQVRSTGGVGHPLLGRRFESPALSEGESIYFTELSLDVLSYLKDHQVFGAVVVPGAAFVEMALSAAREVLGKAAAIELNHFSIEQPLIIKDGEVRKLQFIIKPESKESAGSNNFTFQILSQMPKHPWVSHATGRVARLEGAVGEKVSIETLRRKYPEAQVVSDLYENFDAVGIEYGPSFQGIEKLWRDSSSGSECLGELTCAEEIASGSQLYEIHPALLDACFQVMGGLPQTSKGEQAYLPVGIEKLKFYQKPKVGGKLWCRVISRTLQDSTAENKVRKSDLRLIDESGEVIADIEGFTAVEASREAFMKSMQIEENEESWLYEVSWQQKILQPVPITPAVATEKGSWLILSDQSGVGKELARQLKEQGQNPVLVYSSDLSIDDPKSYAYLVEKSLKAEEGLIALPLMQVVHLWGLDAAPSMDQAALSLEQLEKEQHLGYGSALSLTQALIAAKSKSPDLCASTRLSLVTRGAQSVGIAESKGSLCVSQAPLWGLGKVIAIEHPELGCKRVDLDPAGHLEQEVQQLILELGSKELEDQVGLRSGERYVARLVRSAEKGTLGERRQIPKEGPYELTFDARGSLDQLEIRSKVRQKPQAGEIEIEIAAAGLNFRDVMNVMGTYPGDPESFGLECSGQVVALGEGVTEFRIGERVLGIASGSFSSHANTRAELVTHLPEAMTHEEAATIPSVFITVEIALNYLGKMKPGERVLIHAAAGGVGLAAIQLAKQAGADIFVTVSSEEKRALMRSLGIKHIMSSRTLDFAEEIMKLTQGEGIDLVLNSLAGEYIPKSISVLRTGGRFLEIGKTGIWSEKQALEFKPGISYFTIALDHLCKDDPRFVGAMLLSLMKRFESKALQPILHKNYSIEDAESAFRFMAQGKHIGKVVLKPKAGLIKEDASYLITGGLGGLGLKVAGWLGQQGAKSLILVGRSAPSVEAKTVIQGFEAQGIQVRVVACDVSNREQTAQLLSDVQMTMPPLKGIIHSAGILDDGVLLDQTFERYRKVMSPKVMSGWNLHVLTQRLPLDFFVLFSSAASLVGNGGQSNYAASNAFLDQLAQYRRTQGLPAVSINWAAWGEVGLAAELADQKKKQLSKKGQKWIEVEQGLRSLGKILSLQSSISAPSQVGVLPIDWNKLSQDWEQGEEPSFLRGILSGANGISPKKKKSRVNKNELLHILEKALPGERKKLVISYLEKEVIQTLGLDSRTPIDPKKGLMSLGMDSLMATEFRNRLKKGLGDKLASEIPATLIFEYPNIEAMGEFLLQGILHVEKPQSAVSLKDNESNRLSQLEQLSGQALEDELDRSLAELKKKGLI